MSIDRWSAELVVAAVGAGALAEGPRWDHRRERLHWVDIPAGIVRRLEPDGATVEVRFDRPVGCIQPTRSGGWAVLLETGLVLTDAEFGILHWIGRHPERPVDVRFNDGGTDPAGRLFAGTMAYVETPGAGSLYRFEPEGATPVRTGVTISNGIGWSADGTTMYYVDSPTRVLSAFDYDPKTGLLGIERVVASFEHRSPDVVPDGLCVDAEDHVWVAFWNGGCIDRISPDGQVVGRVTVPVSRPTCPAFGGPDLDLLYITSAAGGLWSTRTGIAGRRLALVDDSIWLS